MTTTPGGYAARWELRPHPVSTNDRRANTKSLEAKPSAIGHTFTHPSCRVRSVSLANQRTATVKARGEDHTLPGLTTRNSATPEGSKSPGNRQALAMPLPAKLGVPYTIGPAEPGSAGAGCASRSLAQVLTSLTLDPSTTPAIPAWSWEATGLRFEFIKSTPTRDDPSHPGMESRGYPALLRVRQVNSAPR
uniref:Uncharacterized protein n=1 Tax=Oryza meridionalis TaxID=40149 RepID=A0A0E0F6T6_9ORYZ